MNLIEPSLEQGEVQLSKVLGLGAIGIDFESLLSPKNEKLLDFRVSLSDVFNPSESKEIFSIVTSVAGRANELLQFIDSKDVDGFVNKVQQIVSETRQKEVTFSANKDGESVRAFAFSNKATLNLTRYPNDSYSVSGSR